MHACNVAQGAEGGNLHAQAHQLIDKFLPPGPQKAAVFLALFTGGVFRLPEELEVQQGVEGENGALAAQQYLQDGQTEHGPIGIGGGVRGETAMRIHQTAHIPVTEVSPTVLRGGGTELGQNGGADLQHPGAAQPRPDGEERLQPLLPGGGSQKGEKGSAAGDGGESALGQGVGNLVVQLTNQLVVHSMPPLSASRSTGAAY